MTLVHSLTPDEKPLVRWPVYAIAVFVGLFVMVVMVLWIYGHILQKKAIDQTAWIVLGASLLRLLTILVALASIQKCGESLPAWIVLGGLAGSASAQLAYPVGELIAKLIILAGLMDYPAKGVGNMSLEGWFNLGAVWFIFGLPGIWFSLAARNYQLRMGLPTTWIWLGGMLGIVALVFIGLAIG